MQRPSVLGRAMGYWARTGQYAQLLRRERDDVRSAWGEFGRRSELFREMVRALERSPIQEGAALGASLLGASRVERFVTGWGPSAVNRELYTMVRLLRPERVVETGVASGISSTIILEALARNGRGHLWSIDRPNYDPRGYLNSDAKVEAVRVPVGERPGWLVPERLRARWTLSLGSSEELLPGVLQQAGPIDLFFHDSEHSTRTMTFEFETAWPALRGGGVLYADDVIWNDAFDRFAKGLGVRPRLTPAGRGGLRKPTAA